MKTSRLIAFYLGEAPDVSGRMIDDVLSWDDEKLESIHDYIQWLFPLQERSAFNSSAPLVTPDDIVLFHKNFVAREKLLLSFARLLDFYGFVAVSDSGLIRVEKSGEFTKKSLNWITPHNDNFLRITRILKSLNLLGCGTYAQAFLRALEEVYKDSSITIGEETLSYWRNAVFHQ